MNFFKSLVAVSWIYLLFWLTYHYGFQVGYEDAKNDYSRYKFNTAVRAFP